MILMMLVCPQAKGYFGLRMNYALNYDFFTSLDSKCLVAHDFDISHRLTSKLSVSMSIYSCIKLNTHKN